MADEQDRLYGAQEAAHLLGIHRSTLNAAIHKRLLIPDHWTPGGHARFRLETLEAFRERMVYGAATGEEGVVAPVRTLATIARLLIEERNPAEIGAVAIAGIRHALPRIDLCGVFRLAPTPQNRFALNIVAQHGIQPEVIERFKLLRSTFRFAITSVLRTLEPEVCDDTASQPIHTGTAQLARIWPIGSYAVVPIVAGGVALGVLICVNHQPRHFSTGDLTFLQGVANTLALALAGSEAHNRQHSGAAVARTLMREAQALHTIHVTCARMLAAPQGESADLDELDELIAGELFSYPHAARKLAEVFLRESGATRLAVLYFPTELPSDDAQLRVLAARVLAGETLVSEQWCEESTVYTGVAIGVPLARDQGDPYDLTRHTSHTEQNSHSGQSGSTGVIVAAWAENRARPEQDEALLLAFASAYLLATS